MRAFLSRAPTAAWICALVACLSATCWSFITPPFEATDEPSHFAYVKQLAEKGTPPTTSEGSLSAEEEYALKVLESFEIRYNPDFKAIYTQQQQNTLEAELGRLNSLDKGAGSPSGGVATAEPPLYYALESIPYRLGSSGTLLDRLQLMRLLSAVFAGFTAMFTFLFLRETLPRERWAWTVGALAVALSPLATFMSGAVSPDALLFAVSAALFYCIARAFRRGLRTRSAIALGLVILAGLLAKLSFIGLAPGAFLALAVLAVRETRRSGRKALRAPAIGAAIGLLPVAGLLVRNTIAGKPLLGIVGGTATTAGRTLLGAANYIWQLYLPRLPGTVSDFPGLFPARAIWFDGYVGRLGWLDTFFPGWVYTAALIPAAAVAALCLRSLILRRAVLRSHVGEIVVYATMTLGMMTLIGFVSYRSFPAQTIEYCQTRYFLPLLPLYAVVVALAARGAGKRWGPTVGALLVVLFLAHDIFSQLQVIARFYG
jgi:4-amino-4-deoxy-L-arabinose transferase-like glycosyltransferase